MHYNARFCRTDRSKAKLSIKKRNKKMSKKEKMKNLRRKKENRETKKLEGRQPQTENSYIFDKDMRKLWHYCKRVKSHVYTILFSQEKRTKRIEKRNKKEGSKWNINKASIRAAVTRDSSPLINTVADLPFLCKKLCTGKLKREFIKRSSNLKIGRI